MAEEEEQTFPPAVEITIYTKDTENVERSVEIQEVPQPVAFPYVRDKLTELARGVRTAISPAADLSKGYPAPHILSTRPSKEHPRLQMYTRCAENIKGIPTTLPLQQGPLELNAASSFPLEKGINIRLVSLTGKTTHMMCTSQQTVADIFDYYNWKEGIPSMRLVCQGKLMQRDQYLWEYDLQEQSVIHVLLSIPKHPEAA